MSDEIDKLRALLDDVKQLGAKGAAEKHGLSPSSLASTIVVARKLGFDLPSRVGRGSNGVGAKPRFNTEVAEKLHAEGVALAEIGAYVGAKATRVSAYLYKVGLLKKPTPLPVAIAKLGLAPVLGAQAAIVDPAPRPKAA